MQTTSTGWRFISNCTQFHLLCWMFPTIGVPQKLDGLSWKTLLKWMIWGGSKTPNPIFGKHSIWNPSILTGWRLGHHPKGKNHFRKGVWSLTRSLASITQPQGQWGKQQKLPPKKPWWKEWHGHKDVVCLVIQSKWPFWKGCWWLPTIGDEKGTNWITWCVFLLEQKGPRKEKLNSWPKFCLTRFILFHTVHTPVD